MGRRATRRNHIDTPSIRDRATVRLSAIQSSMSSADCARVDNALSGNARHIELASSAGVTRRHVQNALSGSGMSFDVACRIADAAGVSLDELRSYIHRNTVTLSA